LQERQIRNASGKNWLFFGDRNAETDFIYRDEIEAMQASGLLNRLDLAFSRDQDAKIYVQDRMIENGAELFAWLEQGGYFFVCGDAYRMAKDVDKALHEVIATHGKLSEQQAIDYVNQLKKDKRYVRDVY
jgi:sulfite reductase (NADPH) flavoprotein alpha-component